MNSYKEIKDSILKINSDFLKLLEESKEHQGQSASGVLQLQKSLKLIEASISEDIVRVAGVGSIKSGKSTFANCLLKGDYLKRGAGVVTSMVTRVLGGDVLRATLYFKKLDDINDEISQALTLFPERTFFFPGRKIDILKESDRELIRRALADLGSEILISNDTKNISCVLLSSYIDGYEKVKDIISSDETEICFENENFTKHHEYVSNDSLSVYLRDLRLEVLNNDLGPHIEIADCQGSDSPNPMHIAMIQDYLVSAHFIIYVISSRTGVRQADIRFLSMLKRMGFSSNMLFVLNCDFSEHDDLSNMESVFDRVREELSVLIPNPVIYRFSSLYHLFNTMEEMLSPKDRARLEQWRDDNQFAKDSRLNFERFQKDLSLKINKGRFILLTGNYVDRLDAALNSFEHWVQLNLNLISRSIDESKRIIEKIEQKNLQIQHIKDMIESTLKGSLVKIKGSIKFRVDRFFDPSSSAIIQKLDEFIRNYQGNLDLNPQMLSSSRFTRKLFFVFQDFRINVDRFITESINPEISLFLKEEEDELFSGLLRIIEPFEVMINEAIENYEKMLDEFGLNRRSSSIEKFDLSIESGKKGIELILPKAQGLLNYNALVKTDAIMRLSVYTCVGWVKKAFNKSSEDKELQTVGALRDAVQKMKRDAIDSIVTHFLDYKENIKFQYLIKMADAFANKISEYISIRFESYITDFSYFLSQIDREDPDKDKIEKLNVYSERIEIIKNQLEVTRQRIEGSLTEMIF